MNGPDCKTCTHYSRTAIVPGSRIEHDLCSHEQAMQKWHSDGVVPQYGRHIAICREVFCGERARYYRRKTG